MAVPSFRRSRLEALSFNFGVAIGSQLRFEIRDIVHIVISSSETIPSAAITLRRDG
jgi:hypothetical protein